MNEVEEEAIACDNTHLGGESGRAIATLVILDTEFA